MASGRNTFSPLSPRVCFVIFEIYVNEESFENRFYTNATIILTAINYTNIANRINYIWVKCSSHWRASSIIYNCARATEITTIALALNEILI